MLTDGGEELLRQVHPIMCPDGEPARTAFTPTKKDDGKLSTLRGRVSADEAYRRHVEGLQLQSAGTWVVTVGEANDAGCVALDDGDDLGVPDHASVDFSEAGSRRNVERAARKLRDAAVTRGCRFVPASPTSGVSSPA